MLMPAGRVGDTTGHQRPWGLQEDEVLVMPKWMHRRPWQESQLATTNPAQVSSSLFAILISLRIPTGDTDSTKRPIAGLWPITGAAVISHALAACPSYVVSSSFLSISSLSLALSRSLNSSSILSLIPPSISLFFSRSPLYSPLPRVVYCCLDRSCSTSLSSSSLARHPGTLGAATACFHHCRKSC